MRRSAFATVVLCTAAYAPRAAALELTVLGTLDARSTVTLEVSGAEPGQWVYVVAGTGSGVTACPPVLQSLCLRPRSPVVVRSGRANSAGAWTASTRVPRTPDGARFELQAAAFGAGGAPSTSTSVFLHNPYSTVAKPTGLGVWTRYPRGTLTESTTSSTWSGSFIVRLENAEGVPICNGAADLTAVYQPVCPSCDFGLSVTVSNVEEYTFSYSRCRDLLGMDLADFYPTALTLRLVGNPTVPLSPKRIERYDAGYGWSDYGPAYAERAYQGPGQPGPSPLSIVWYGLPHSAVAY